MDDSKMLLEYMAIEVNSYLPIEEQAAYEYVETDKGKEEVSFAFGGVSERGNIDQVLKYVRGVRNTLKFMNDYNLRNLSNKG